MNRRLNTIHYRLRVCLNMFRKRTELHIMDAFFAMVEQTPENQRVVNTLIKKMRLDCQLVLNDNTKMEEAWATHGRDGYEHVKASLSENREKLYEAIGKDRERAGL